MEIGGSGNQAAKQLMEATNSVADLATQQMQAVNAEVQQAKDAALQNTAKQMSASVERKGNAIDLMA